MKWGTSFCAVAVVVLAAWIYAGPYLALRGIKNSLEDENPQAMYDYVDFPRLKKNLKRELLKDVKQQTDNPLAEFGVTLVEGMIDMFVNPESIIKIFSDKKTDEKKPDMSEMSPKFDLSKEKLKMGYTGLGSFELSVPSDDGVWTFILHRSGFGWKIDDVHIELNETKVADNRNHVDTKIKAVNEEAISKAQAAAAAAEAAADKISAEVQATNALRADSAVTSVELGSAVDGNNKILSPTSTFIASDSIHVSVSTEGLGGVLAVKWLYQNNQIVSVQNRSIGAGVLTTDFSISKPDGFPSGEYQVEISLNGEIFHTQSFEIRPSQYSLGVSQSGSPHSDGSAGENVFTDSTGVSYQWTTNANGVQLQAPASTIYLGKSCDAFSPEFGNGTWGWANGGFTIEFTDGMEIGFPRQEIDAGNGMNCQL